MRDPQPVFEPAVLETWVMPHTCDIAADNRTSFHNRRAALLAYLTGAMCLTHAARENRVCPKRLKEMARRAPLLAPDGMAYGFRVCVPWGAYHAPPPARGNGEPVQMPARGGPRAMTQLLAAQPTIAEWIDGFSTPLPPGRPPRAFNALHGKVVAELRRQDHHDRYPLNQKDRGREALLRYLRRRRVVTQPIGDLDPTSVQASTLEEIFLGVPFSRTEIDGHRIDIEAKMAVPVPEGGSAIRDITTLWLIVEVETRSRAIVSWTLRVGRAYNNLDLADCIARGLRRWPRRELIIEDMVYAPGAGMPSAAVLQRLGWRTRSTALDNAMSHASLDFEQAYCRAHGGMLIFGRAHEPRSRPIVEQLLSRLERGALRKIPGGFEPATRLGENRIRISNFSPNDHPIQIDAFLELLEVIICNYNATPHPALGNLSPLQFLQMEAPRAFDFTPDSGEDDARDMGHVLVPLKVHGNRKTGVMPHVNYMYVRYRSPELDGCWELVGKIVYARVCRHDLRTLVLLRSSTRPIGVVRAAAPWNRTPHDVTTRALIMQWTKLREGFSIAGVDCAIKAYVGFLESRAHESPQAVNELGRMHHVADARRNEPAADPAPTPNAAAAPIKLPYTGWVSLDDEVDC